MSSAFGPSATIGLAEPFFPRRQAEVSWTEDPAGPKTGAPPPGGLIRGVGGERAGVVVKELLPFFLLSLVARPLIRAAVSMGARGTHAKV